MTDAPRFRPDVNELHRPYAAADDRYASTGYRQVGTSGLYLPPISLGLWWNFGDNIPFDNQRAVLRHAFDIGITHFDLANNYGPPYGTAETNFGRMMREDFAPYRDELILSSKAGYDMWPGPYGDLGSRKYILASAEQSLKRMSVDYVDIFYSHRVDPVTPIEETIGALDTLVRAGQGALRRHLVVQRRAHGDGRGRGTQPRHAAGDPPAVVLDPQPLGRGRSDRRAEAGGHGRDRLHAARAGTADRQVPRRRYRRPRPEARFRCPTEQLSQGGLSALRSLDLIAKERGQTLAQMAIQWVLRDPVVTSALIGASRPEQLDENVAALYGPAFDTEELEQIDTLSGRIDVDLWAESAQL